MLLDRHVRAAAEPLADLCQLLIERADLIGGELRVLVGLVERDLRRVVLRRELDLALLVLERERVARLREADLDLLLAIARAQCLEARARLAQVRLGARDRDLERRGIEHEQRIARMDRLVLAHEHAGDRAGRLTLIGTLLAWTYALSVPTKRPSAGWSTAPWSRSTR